MTLATALTLTLALTRNVVDGQVTWYGQIDQGIEPLYAVADSAEDCKLQVIENLKARGLTGKLVVTYPQAVRQEKRLATEKQVGYAMHLFRRKIKRDSTEEELKAMSASYAAMTLEDMKMIIDNMVKMDDLKETKTLVEKTQNNTLEDGIYMIGDDIFKVLTAVHGSGFKYAKKLNKGGGFAKAPAGSMTLIREKGEKLTAERAKEYGAIYGSCCCCGKTLTDEQSIADGVGPICKAKYL